MLVLQWKKFRKLTEARKAFAKEPCIYVQTNAKGEILRVGSATEGLSVRYRGGTGYALDAAMHGTQNLVFAAAVPKEVCRTVEAILIYEAKPSYNNQGKRTLPSTSIKLAHFGDAPAFGTSARDHAAN